ncbi:MAG: tRNA lysidine(34) synthetase TilS [Synergistales bacterium]|nr:tRNA lysidine(34) synthetase TilS [Synergistales bacterium]
MERYECGRVILPAAIRESVVRHGEKEEWLYGSGTILVAVSGGCDSVALLVILAALVERRRLVVAHLEHGMRGQESLEDAAFVRRLATSLHLPFSSRQTNITRRKERHESGEQCGRRLRYAFLEQAGTAHGASWIATAHIEDDQVESILFNIARGSGLDGLQGIARKRGRIIRPLLDIDKETLRAFLLENGYTWKEDHTNRDIRYSRNYIRAVLIPGFDSVNSGARKHILSLGKEAEERVLWDRRWAEARISAIRHTLPFGLDCWRQEALRRREDPALQILFRVGAERLGLPTLERKRLEELIALLRRSASWRFQWKEDFELFCGKGMIVWGKRCMLDLLPSCPLRSGVNGRFRWGPWEIRLDVGCAGATSGEVQSGWTTCFAVEPDEEVLLRPVSGGLPKKKRRAVPWWARAQWPVVLCGDGRWWVPYWGGRNGKSDGNPSAQKSNHVRMIRLNMSLGPDSAHAACGQAPEKG